MNALTYIGSSDGFRLAAAGVLVPAMAWLLAWLVAWIGRRASAATRHLVWLLSFIAMAAWIPCAFLHFGISVPILPPKSPPPSAPVKLPVFLWQEKPEPVLDYFPSRFRFDVSKIPARGETQAVRPPEMPPQTPPWLILSWALWAAGAGILVLKSLAGVLRLQRVIRASRIPDDETLVALHSELCASVGLRKTPGLLISRSVTVPLVTGVWQPRVILPEAACDWPKPMLRAALVHELAHVRRGDLLSSAFARLVVAIYWFNPLAWLGLRALQAEAEMAADDCVVTLESQPVAYAESLVALVRDLRNGAVSPFPAIGMLRRAGIEARVKRILNPSCGRAIPRRQIQWAACCGVALVVAGLAVLRPVAAAPALVRPFKGSTALQPFTPEPFSMDLGYTDVIKIKDNTYDIVNYLPAGNGPRYGQKIEPLLSPAKTTPFDMAMEPKFTMSVRSELRTLPIPYSGHNWNVDSPGPGYREQRDIPLNGEGAPFITPKWNNGSNWKEPTMSGDRPL